MFVGVGSRIDLERRAARVLTTVIVALLVSGAIGAAAVQRRPMPPGDRPGAASPSGSAVVLLQYGLPPLTTPGSRAPAPSGHAAASRPRPVQPAAPPGYGCRAALAWLSSHAAPGFRFVCPGYAQGHQAMTCRDMPGVCPGQALIIIADPCPAAYMNEAWNSLLAVGLAYGPVDPYGSCP